MNLITDPWLPVRRADGSRATISPAQITSQFRENPVIRIDWPRADFHIATLEMLVGLMRLAGLAQDRRDWRLCVAFPPSPAELEAAFAPFAHAFNLWADGDAPRFLQDLDPLDGREKNQRPATDLLLDLADGNPVTMKPGFEMALSPGAAAIALYTLQAWAHPGGRGHYSTLRGASPLVQLVQPRPDATLWEAVWANTPRGKAPEAADLPRIFPWLAPTITGIGGRSVRPVRDDAHDLQAFWPMPRRIRLCFEPANGRACSITGTEPEVVLSSFWMQSSGVRYADWAGVHPLTPVAHLSAGKDGPRIKRSLKARRGLVGYRHYHNLALLRPDAPDISPAPATQEWLEWRGEAYAVGRGHTNAAAAGSLLLAGYETTNSKALSFLHSRLPIFAMEPEAAPRVHTEATLLTQAADFASQVLRVALNDALFLGKASYTGALDGSNGVLLAVTEQLEGATEALFYDTLARVREDAGVLMPGREAWVARLRLEALRIFDEEAPLDPLGSPANERIAKARRILMDHLFGRTDDARKAITKPLGISLTLRPANTVESAA
ncbi:type I-E CRISPR-associated protein Cse1/CasA [Sabulicella rubraurantiaca]|uniref:type I-E CRISPR-associated protein Cse1/CasA n=1 Tax=Sabulicella rubraurantiaca TaxID=2811429 RepID=UPI001A96E386|nr:type I-E CRISPR-associated protein Cse1/CasA [Sabulicella rubraurantiaca]